VSAAIEKVGWPPANHGVIGERAAAYPAEAAAD